MMPSVRSAVLRHHPTAIPIVSFGLHAWDDRFALWVEGRGIISPWMPSIAGAYQAAFIRLPLTAGIYEI